MRFAGAKSFDETAVEGIHSFFGKNNIIEFHATGDLIAEYLDLPQVEAVLGHRVSFSAEESGNYERRVSGKVYTHMDKNLKQVVGVLETPWCASLACGLLRGLSLGKEVVDFLKPAIWERHQPVLYRELCPPAFEDFKNRL